MCTASVDGGARVVCTDGTASFLRHGIDGVDGTNGLNGENGEDGDDCFITSISNGVTITCGSGDTATVESLQHGNSCSVSTAGNGLSVSCGEGDSVSTGAISGFSSIEPFGMAMINDASGTLSQNDTLFLRFLSPATGVIDHLTLMSGGNNTDVQLEVGLFIRGDSGNWHLVEESNVITFSDPTEDAYRRITGSGLNALLEQHASYKIGIRNLSTTPWIFQFYTHL